MRWLIVGCGYTGGALARAAIARGDDVVVVRRNAAAASALAAELGPRAVALAADLAAAPLPEAPAGTIAVHLAPPGRDPAREAANLVAAAPARVVYVSSTGVYAPAGGAWVDEAFPTEPATASGRARLAAERAIVAAAPSAVLLRAAGIHGPGRGIADRLRAGTYRIVGDGSAHVSRVHVDDLVAAILAAGRSGVTGAINVADDDPAPIGAVADAVAAALGLPPPPRVSPATVDPEIAGMLGADRRIANRRLRDELGVELRYPSWRALLAR
jgi:nucleoside-diphosphate-sugar epimerase|nr:NAD-dependent epimerase/dehydratase family protein [Kofleriaceae bacterium]